MGPAYTEPHSVGDSGFSCPWKVSNSKLWASCVEWMIIHQPADRSWQSKHMLKDIFISSRG